MSQQVIIIGANLTGLFTALALSKFNQSTILVDKNDISLPIKNDGRAIALSYRSKQIIEDLGIWEQFELYAGKIEQIRVTDQYSPLFLHFDNHCTLGYIIESQDLQRIAYQHIKKDPNITIMDQSKYELLDNNCDTATIKLNDKLFDTPLIIAADGKFSNLRKLCKIEHLQHDYKQVAIVCKVQHQQPHNNIAQEIFLPHGPFAILPLNHPCQSGIVWTETAEDAKIITKLAIEKFNYFLQTKFTNYLGDVEVISGIASYPLELVMAKKYYHNRVMLIGDSAHSIHPISGQGFNLALRDIEAFINIYKEFTNLGLAVGCYQSLAKYQKLRMNDNISMAVITDTLNKLFSNDAIAINILRKLGLHTVNQMPKLQKFFMEYAMAKRTT